jgi:hypothetical protein
MQTYSADGTRLERTNWRDQSISARHRQWGFNCPAVDLDFLVVEYNIGKPVGLIEYKHHRAVMPNFNHATYRALSAMADVAKLPFLVAFYWPDIWAFKVFPVNRFAAEVFSPNEVLTERDYVSKLYTMRRRVLAKELNGFLKTELPQ